MSQKEEDFQSKPKFGGQKSGGKKFGGKGFGGKGKGRGFGKGFERDSGDRPRRGGGGGFGRRDRGEGSEGREKRGWGDKPFKARGDRPFREKSDRPFRERSDRPFREKSDRPFREKSDRPFREKSDRPFREKSDRPFRGGDKPRFEKRSYEKKPWGEKREWSGERPRRDNRDGGFKKDRDFKDRGFKDRGFKDRGGFKGDRDFKGRGDKPFGKKRDFGEKSFDRPQKNYKRYEDRNERPAPAEPASYETRQALKSDRQSYGTPSSAFLYGVHAVRAALLNPKRLHQRLLCTQEGYAAIEDAAREAAENGLHVPEVIWVEKEDISRLLPRDAVHQGILLDCQPPEEVFLKDILISAPEDAKILVLDQVTDPHNVGAILRSAAAFGAIAVVVQKLHAPDITGTLAKSASGAVEHVPLVREVNLTRALEQMKDAGFFCIGLDERGKEPLSASGYPKGGKIGLVLGAEGEGLRRLVSETCDTLAKLPTEGPISSLNVSNAAAVALYEVSRA